MGYYQRSIEQEADNPYAFANRGFTYNLLGRYHEAITDFSNVIESDAYPDYAYANRGYAKIKLNKIEEGLADSAGN